MPKEINCFYGQSWRRYTLRGSCSLFFTKVVRTLYFFNSSLRIMLKGHYVHLQPTYQCASNVISYPYYNNYNLIEVWRILRKFQQSSWNSFWDTNVHKFMPQNWSIQYGKVINNITTGSCQRVGRWLHHQKKQTETLSILNTSWHEN